MLRLDHIFCRPKLYCTVHRLYQRIYSSFGHLWLQKWENFKSIPRDKNNPFLKSKKRVIFGRFRRKDAREWIFDSGRTFFRYITKTYKSFWFYFELNKFNTSSLTTESRFSEQRKMIWSFQHLILFGTYVFWALNIPHTDEKDSKTPIFTRKTPKYM